MKCCQERKKEKKRQRHSECLKIGVVYVFFRVVENQINLFFGFLLYGVFFSLLMCLQRRSSSLFAICPNREVSSQCDTYTKLNSHPPN